MAKRTAKKAKLKPARVKKKKPTTGLVAAAKPVDPAQVYEVIAWLVAGNREWDVKGEIAVKFPAADAETLLVAAITHFEGIADADRKVIRGWCLEAYRELYRRALETGDYASAVRSVKELQKLAT